MLFRLDNPRLVMNAQEFPENMVLYCLAYANCAGDVVVNFIDHQSSRLVTQPIQPTRSLVIFEGVSVNEYVIPFDQLVDSLGRRGSTSGFTVIGRSSYRVAGADYQVRTLEFTMIFPVIGGGIIRIRAGEQEWEIANPTFNPRAGIPPINTSYSEGVGNEYISGPPGINNQRVPGTILVNAYQRTHRGFIGQAGSEIERRRQERLANFDLNEGVETSRMDPVNEQSSLNTPARHGPTNVLTGRPRLNIEDPVAIAVEQRRQDRLNQVQQADQTRPGSVIIGVHPGEGPSSSVNIIAPVTRKPKDPPKTRFQRVQENCEEANEPKE